MKTASICSVLALACVMNAAVVVASPIGPTVEVTVDGRHVELPAITFDGKLWRLDYADTTGTSPLTGLQVSGDTDPFIDYWISVQNVTSGALNFSMSITSPYVGGPYNRVTLRHGDTVTDLGPDGATTIVPFSQPFVAQASLDNVAVVGLSSGCTVTAPPTPQTCFPDDETAASVSSLATGLFTMRVAFNLPGGDTFEASGNVTLDNARVVPEASSMLLIGAALVGVLGARRRR